MKVWDGHVCTTISNLRLIARSLLVNIFAQEVRQVHAAKQEIFALKHDRYRCRPHKRARGLSTQARPPPRATQRGMSNFLSFPNESRLAKRFRLQSSFHLSRSNLTRHLRSQKLGKRVKMIRELVRDVAGSAPYEKRLMELLKVGRDKRALKLAKRKVRRLLGFCSNFLVRTTRTQT